MDTNKTLIILQALIRQKKRAFISSFLLGGCKLFRFIMFKV
jgi:hypothetical protein